MPGNADGASRDEYVEHLRRGVDAQASVTRQQNALIRELIDTVRGLRERMEQATAAEALLRRAHEPDGRPVQPVRPRRDRHGLHVVPAAIVASAAAFAWQAWRARLATA